MATSTTQIRHSSPEPESTNGGPEDLQKLLQNLEFENTQQLILIDKENQQIEALEKDLKHKQEAIQTLQESTAQLDEQTKRVHRQFKQNRENLGSLKKTSDVLVEHEEALVKKFERLKVAWETDNTEHEAATAHYESIWESYKNKYEDNPAARELAKQLNVLQDLEITADKASQTVEDLRCAIDIIKGKQEKPFESLTNWMISVAEVGKELGQTECEIQATQKNIIELQKTNEDLKDKEEKISEPSSRGDKGSKQQDEDESVMQGQDEGHQSSEVVDESTEGMDHHSNDLTHNLETEERCGLQPSQDATIKNQQRENSQTEMLRPSKPPPTRNHSVLGQVPQINIPRQQLPSRTHTEIQVPRLQTLSERSCYVAAPKQHCPSNRLSVNVPQLHVPAMNLGSPQHIRQQKPHQQSSSLLWQMQNQQLQRKLESFLPSVPPVPLQKPLMPQKQAQSQQAESLPPPASHFSQTSQQISRELGGSRLPTLFPEKTGDTNRDSSPPLSQVEDMNGDLMEQPRNISNSTTQMNSEIDRSIVGTPSPSLSPSSQHTGGDISPFNEARHAAYLESLRKSPGFTYSSRAMFDVGKANPGSQQIADKSKHVHPESNASNEFETPFFQSAFDVPFGQAEFGNSQQDDNHTRSNGSNSGNTGPQSIFGSASPTLPLPGESTNGGSIFSQGEQPSSNQESTSAFAMFGFNNTEDNSSTSSSAFSFNFGGGGDNSPNTSSGGFSLF